MKKLHYQRILGLAVLALLLSGCGAASQPEPPGPSTDETVTAAPELSAPSPAPEDAATAESPEEGEVQGEMKLRIGDTPVTVEWEENETVEALRELVGQGELTVELSMYGGFEQVGPLGRSLPRSDVQTTTRAGDIVLYSGSQIVLFYGSNSWAYTRLGHISDPDEAGLAELLGSGDVEITLSTEGQGGGAWS